jgi:hypothetical protein
MSHVAPGRSGPPTVGDERADSEGDRGRHREGERPGDAVDFAELRGRVDVE